MLFGGSFFKSYVATKHFDGREIVSVNGVHTTTFMLAVQETNFLYSFTLSAFSALATFLSSNGSSSAAITLFILSGVYSIYGFIISVWLYGRKTTHNPDALNRKESVIYKSLDPSSRSENSAL